MMRFGSFSLLIFALAAIVVAAPGPALASSRFSLAQCESTLAKARAYNKLLRSDGFALKPHALLSLADGAERIRQSAGFRLFAEEQPWVSSLDKTKQAQAWLEHYFGRLQGETLEGLRLESLSRSLLAHGWKVRAGAHPRASLRQLSRANLERLVLPYAATPELRRAERLLGRLDLYFAHNTRRLTEVPRLPILSSARLGELGFSGGVNTASFNREFMVSDDNVFFWIEPFVGGKLPKAGVSSYGEKELALDPDYASENGWISAFVMYPDELLDAGGLVQPRLTRGLRQYIDENQLELSSLGNREGRGFDVLLEKFPTLLADLRASLHRLDFTVEDFRSLYRNRALVALERIRRRDPIEFAIILEKLGRGEVPFELSAAVTSGLGGVEFEFKIPVAVSPEALRLREPAR